MQYGTLHTVNILIYEETNLNTNFFTLEFSTCLISVETQSIGELDW